MNRVAKVGILAGAGLVIYSLFRKANAGGTLIFSSDRIYSLRLENLTPTIVFGLRVQNTSNQPFTIFSFAADIKHNNYVIGNASFFQAQTIPKNSEVILQIKVRLSLLGVVNDLINAFQTKDFTYNISVNGFANVDQLQVPVNLSYKIGV